MSWVEKLSKTYENNAGSVGSGDIPLLPVCHTTQNAQVNIVIDGDGSFLRASVIPKSNARTIIPATEESAGRSGKKPTNFPLCDKLQYVAGDFLDYGGTVTSGFSKDPHEPHDNFLKLLNAWCVSPYRHPKIVAVHAYVKKNSTIEDLVKAGILHCSIPSNEGERPRLLNQWPDKSTTPDIFKLLPGGKDSKGKGKPWQGDAFVRWSVELPNDESSNLWSDKSVWRSWQEYYGSLRPQKGFCYVTGSSTVLADQHPAKIRNDGDKAKLISSNDITGFTFKGRFVDSSEACGIGFEVTQKAHSALRWLMARQGYVHYVKDGGAAKPSLAIVAWAVSGAKVPDPTDDTLALLFKGQEESARRGAEYTAQEIGNKLRTLLAGYSAQLGPTDDVVVMGLDSATPGRMAMRFYRELTGSDFLARVMGWHDMDKGCVWRQYFAKDKIFVGAPAPRDIAECAYGKRIDDKLRRSTVERLLPCIVDGAPIPRDVLKSCIRRASSRQGLEYWEWEKVLGVACALYRHHHKEREYIMALERDRKTRDYLYGRLLAAAEFLEGLALNVAGECRDTNAAKLMQRFADRPYSTWRSIELALVPYKTRLRSKRPGFLTNMEMELDEIESLFQTDEYMRDNALSGEFLIAYHCERKWLWDNLQRGCPADDVGEEASNEQKGEAS